MEATFDGRTMSQPVSKMPWVTYLFVAVAFFMIEHELSAQLRFQDIQAATLGQIDASATMFKQSPLRQIGGLSLGMFGLACILRKRRSAAGSLGILGGLILLFIGWAFLSVLWADDLGLTFRRLVFFAMLCLGVVALADRWSLRQVMLFGLLCPGAYLAVGLLAEVSANTFHPLVTGYRFAGTLHPNAQAVNCALAILAALMLMRDAKRGKRLWLIVAALVAFGFLFLTRSRSAMASTLLVVVILWGFMQPRARQVPFTLAGVAGVCLVFLLADLLLPLLLGGVQMGRVNVEDTFITLTGRRPLWRQCLGFAAERPVLGYGYGGFWNVSRTIEVLEKQGWPVSHAHNAYLDVGLQLGPIGLLCYVFILILGIKKAFDYYRASGDTGYAYLWILLVFCTLNGILESVAIRRTQLTFLAMLALVYLAFHKAPQARTAAARAGPDAEGLERQVSEASATSGAVAS